jgi:IMP dehydrogenase
MQDKIKSQAFTFDDVLLEPRYSELVPSEVDVSTRLTRRIALKSRCSAPRWTP